MINIYQTINIIVFLHVALAIVTAQRRTIAIRFGLAVDEVLVEGRYGLLWTSSWIHAHWTHLSLNAVVLLVVGHGVAWHISPMDFLFLYFMSQFGGSLLALFTYRNDRSGQRDAMGAAGGISGVLFASIALDPSLSIESGLLSLPVWPLAIVFIVVSVFALRPYSSTMIHDAHLGGAMTGLLLTPLVAPELLQGLFWTAIAIMIPTVVLFYALVKAPENLFPRVLSRSSQHFSWSDTEYQTDEYQPPQYASLEEEMDALLDKISHGGYKSLSDYEFDRLRSISGDE